MKLLPEILTHPNIPKPLHGVNPRNIKGQEWWDKTRQEAYASTDYHCIACGVHKSEAKWHTWLEAHEYYTIDYKEGIVQIEKIVPLCHSCHQFIHSGLMVMNLRDGKIDRTRFKAIIQHGCDILYNNTLKGFSFTIDIAHKLHCDNIPDAYESSKEFADWDKWYLELEGEKYYSKFKNIEEWSNHKW